VRRRRFEHAHPEAVIVRPCAGRWRAVVPAGLIPEGDGTRTTLGAWHLCDLMNQLDAIYPPTAENLPGSNAKASAEETRDIRKFVRHRH
jgi:hypothetical protein